MVSNLFLLRKINRFVLISDAPSFKKMYPLVVPLTWRMQQQIWWSSNSALPSRQPFDIFVWVMLVIAHFLTVLPHTGITATTIKSIVQAGSSFSSDFNAITQFITSFPNNTCNAAGSESCGVDIDVQGVFTWGVAAVFNDTQVVWVNTIISEAVSNLKLHMNQIINDRRGFPVLKS